MGAIDHDCLLLVLLGQLLLDALDAVGIEVGTSGATTEDDEAVWVASSSCDSGEALLGDTHEVVLSSCRANGINSDSQTAVSAVLEADWEGETGSQLAVQLRLSGSSTNCSEGDQISEELRGDGIKHLRCNWHSSRGQIAEELSADSETLVDLEALIDIWIVDQALPADSCARLLEVSTHDNADVIRELVRELLQASAVLQCGGWVVDRARADHDKKAVVGAHDDISGIFAALEDGLASSWSDWDLGKKELWWDEGVLSKDLAKTISIIL